MKSLAPAWSDWASHWLGPGAGAAAALFLIAPAFGADVELGRYLGSECAACHAVGGVGGAAGIPDISGWPPERFAATLGAFRSGERASDVMSAIARRLNDEEIAALAAYFGGLAKQN